MKVKKLLTNQQIEFKIDFHLLDGCIATNTVIYDIRCYSPKKLEVEN